jgi:hypothetical protein
VCNGKLQSCCRACPELVEGPFDKLRAGLE